ncbi:MAG: hypothetical protein J5710_04745, partial [Treponema sp.]|nr:hypothetical protein [Treponema sp.]
MGPAWANSLFEDNAEHGFGIALAVKQKRNTLEALMKKAIENPTCECGDTLCEEAKKLFQEWIDNKEDAEKTKELYPKIMNVLANGDPCCETLDR